MPTEAPIPPGSFIEIRLTDENDPTGPMEVYLVQPAMGASASDLTTPSRWMLGSSFGARDSQFFWMVRGLAAFHGLKIEVAPEIKERWEKD